MLKYIIITYERTSSDVLFWFQWFIFCLWILDSILIKTLKGSEFLLRAFIRTLCSIYRQKKTLKSVRDIWGGFLISWMLIKKLEISQQVNFVLLLYYQQFNFKYFFLSQNFLRHEWRLTNFHFDAVHIFIILNCNESYQID